ncbi:MAG: hypothetical protein A4S17_01425 [Proteobacteria bacterium HN_bin10]|nr:MAG: hypothetical protein A4S17_01425 [Proteobacteria bacterium HN_bin10]
MATSKLLSAVLPPMAAHIREVKRRLIVIAATICASFALAFAYSSHLIAWFKRPFQDDLVFYGPTEALFASVKLSFLAGIVLSLPVILYQCWKFVEPALLPREQRWAIPLFCLAAGFFALGMTFGNLVILPLVIQFFVSFGMDRTLTPQLAVETYVDFNVKFLLIFGFAFELPLVMTMACRIGAATPDMFSAFRRHAIMVALIVSAVVTPDATLFTMLLMAVPLILLYEIGIWGAYAFGRRKSAGQSNQDTQPEQELAPTPTGTAGHRLR